METNVLDAKITEINNQIDKLKIKMFDLYEEMDKHKMFLTELQKRQNSYAYNLNILKQTKQKLENKDKATA